MDGRNFPAEAEDAVQDAFMQFFEGVQTGKYGHPINRDDLWRILSMMTVQKVRKQLTREYAKKRGGGHVLQASQLKGGGSGSYRLDEALAVLPTAEWDLAFAELLEQLSPELQDVAIMRLAGYTNAQIKDLLACSLRSVERRVQIIRTIWHENDKDNPSG
jgi:DNA-directed RNA polymerase specialized sigma24 family protein